MPDSPPRILRAWLDSLSSGVVEFERNRGPGAPPRLTLGADGPAITGLAPAPGLAAGRTYAYFVPAPGDFCFVLPLEHGCDIDPEKDQVFVAGSFNGWERAVGQTEWRLVPGAIRN